MGYTFSYNKSNQVTRRRIDNSDYVFNGFKLEGITNYATNGLNQYDTVGETLLGIWGQYIISNICVTQPVAPDLSPVTGSLALAQQPCSAQLP